MSINRVNISGNLTRDPELRSMPSGTPVLTFGVAVNDRVKDQQSGEWRDRPNYIDCVLFGARAQGLARFLNKGTKVAVEGKLHYSKWQAQDGSNRSKIEVYVDEVEFLSSRDRGQQGGGYPAAGQAQPYPQNNYQPQQTYQQQPQNYQQPQQTYQQKAQQPAPQTFGSGNGGFAASVPPAPAPAPAQDQAPAPAQAGAPAPSATQAPAGQTPPSTDVYDEDIPF
ncbi:MAG: single-stranded DNA-binding protein [Olegusella sp.]|nr:single-stranded DNA-binding protein [Olegusella sp.]